MADIRINDLSPDPNPSPSDNLAVDGPSTRRSTVQQVVNSGAPVASQSEAESGVNNTKRMTPVTTKQSIASEVGVTIASAIQGLKADSAVQPGSLGNSATRNVGNTSGTVAAGDDSRIVNSFQNTGGNQLNSGNANFTPSPAGDSTLFVRGPVNLSNGISLSSKSNDFSTNKKLEVIADQLQVLSAGGPVVVKGSAGTELSPQSLHVFTQPQATGSATGSYLMNRFEAEFHREQLGDGSIEGDEGSGIVNLLHCYIGVGGPNFKADSVAAAAFGTVINQADTSIGDRLGFNSGVLAMFSTTARLYGGSTGVTIAEGASAAQMIGFEADMFLYGSAPYKFGFHSWAGGKHQATVVDAAYGIGIRGGTIDGDPVAKWKTGICLFTGTSGNRPMDENSEFLNADASMSLKNLFNLSNVTIVEDIIKSSAVTISGDGELTLGNNVETGSVALNSPAATAAFYSVQQGGAAKWTWGVDGTGKWFIYNVVGTKTVLTIDPATSSVLIDDDLGVSGLINGTVINETAWAAFTPTITPQSGTITTVGAVSGKYKRLPGRTIVAQVRATITTAGTAGGGIVFTLPVAASTDIPAVVNGRESALNGRSLCGLTNGTTGFVTYSDASTPFADGVQVTVEVTYEASAAL